VKDRRRFAPHQRRKAIANLAIAFYNFGMKRDFLNQLTLDQLQELRWIVYWQQGSMVGKTFFNWSIKQGIIKTMFEILGDLDEFNRWDVEEEIERRSLI